MLAVFYLLICLLWGLSFIRLTVPDVRRLYAAIAPSKNIASNIPDELFTVPAGFVTGILCVGMFNYYVTSVFARFMTGNDFCKKSGILVTLAFFIVMSCINAGICLKRKPAADSPIPRYDRRITSILIYSVTLLVSTCLATFVMFYTYRMNGSVLMAGYSTFSDLSPHTAMMSSFSKGFNFPTQYMHFSGDGIQYHFFFYFFCGMLNYLGLPLDWALNLPSIIVMVSTFALAGLLAVLFSRRRISFIFIPLLVLFRSSFNFTDQIKDQTAAGKSLPGAVRAIFQNDAWYGKTPFDDWGIWSVNVYANQRHLMLGTACILLLVILMTPFVRRMTISLIKSGAEGVGASFRQMFASREAWLWRKEDPIRPLGILILSCIIAVTMPYFHGSALIAVLLILAFMALLSESRLIYLAIAVCSVVSSVIQSQLFSGGAGKILSLKRQEGFVCTDKTFAGETEYLIKVTGLTLIIGIIYAIVLLVRDIMKDKPIYRSLIFICFLIPLFFAFRYQVTLEMLANHKFIQFTLILVDIFVAGALAELFCLPVKNKKTCRKALFIPAQILSILVAVCMFIPLFTTGVFEWCTYINVNRNRLNADTKSELVEWIEENTSPDDVFLTPAWSYNRFFLAGRPAYFGHPYYAMSAGHDTIKRDEIYYWLLSGCNGNIDEFVRYCKERNIRYLVEDPEIFTQVSDRTGRNYNAVYLREHLTPVAYFYNDNFTTVYKIW